MITARLPRTVLITAALVLLAVGGTLLYYLWFRHRDSVERPDRPDPRLTYTGPFRNIRSNVAYVPDSRCGSCHAAIAASFAEHPMGRSLLPVADAPALPTGKAQHNPFVALGEQYRVEAGGMRVRHVRTRHAPTGEPAAELSWNVDYVIGSGTRGYSYLCDHDGYLFETPISWYSQKHAWDLSPGFGPNELPGRAIVAECLFCHANRANQVAGTVNRYQRPVFDGHAIGCQRCHGPGALHVESAVARSNGIDHTIVNPKHLTAELRQAICEQCHLQGAIRTVLPGRDVNDFRPGLPLEQFWAVFVHAPEAGESRRAVGQVEQMYESRCYQAGSGTRRMGCVSCHDPHERVRPADHVAHYRRRCLECHQQHGCSLPSADRLRQSAEDSCIACHMPPYGASDIPHTAVTDHRIRRGGKSSPAKTQAPPGDGMPIVSFYRGRPRVDPADDDRSRAVALTRLTLLGDTAARGVVRYLVPTLEAARRRDPDDWAAGEALGYALAAQDRSTDALEVLQAVLAKAPQQESALTTAALLAETMGKTEVAVGYWQRAAAVNPWAPAYRQRLALLLVKLESWDAALAECDLWIRLDPLNAAARAARVSCLLSADNKAEARAEFARIVALAPANLTELKIRFERKLK
jgi:hypothetical protein